MAKNSDKRLGRGTPDPEEVFEEISQEEIDAEDEETQQLAQDAHTSQELDPARMDRGLQDRDVTENREYTDIERLDLLRLTLAQDRLPNLPKLPGWHMIWLSTNNASDTIQYRLKLGYQLVKSTELPGWEHSVVTEGSYAGYVMINEMIAAKLPEHLYQMYMKHFHHDEPNREQAKLVANLDGLREQAESFGAKLVEGQGMAALRENVNASGFSD